MAITREEIEHLGTLARIRLSDTEVTQFQGEVTAILDYVSAINEIVAESDMSKAVGPVHNVFRTDEVTNPLAADPDELIAAFPEKDGRYLQVKKILQNDE